MIRRQISTAVPIYIAIYIFQEALINQFRLPWGGFSLLLIVCLIWAILSSPEIAALGGFISGVLMDLSQSSSGPIGQWTLLMVTASCAVSYLGSGSENLSDNPLGFTFLTTSAIVLLEIAYLTTGALLGVTVGGLRHILFTLIGISIWSMLVTPLVLPIFSRLHAFTFDTRSAL